MVKEELLEEDQIKEILGIFRICSNRSGWMGKGYFAYLMVAYFKKYSKTLLVEKDVHGGKMYISSEESMVDLESGISVKEVLDDLVRMGFLKYTMIHAEDKFGEKIYRDNEKTIPRYVQVVKIKE